VKRTNKFVDELLQESKQELQSIAYDTLSMHLFGKIRYEMTRGQYLCTSLTEDLEEKIDLFLKTEGYNK
jgi:hypothetical protein